MALSIEVAKPLDGGRVQVDAKSKFFGKDIVSHYSVPKEKADEFISDYKKENKNRTKNGVLAGVITVASMFVGSMASKGANPILKTLSVMLFGLAGGIASVAGFGMKNAKNANKIFEKHNAMPIFYVKEEIPEKPQKAEGKAENPQNKAETEAKKD